MNDREKVVVLQRKVESLEQQLDWFKRQLFGRKSEKRLIEDTPEQPLLDGLGNHHLHPRQTPGRGLRE